LAELAVLEELAVFAELERALAGEIDPERLEIGQEWQKKGCFWGDMFTI
jgi:hypothetical protein